MGDAGEGPPICTCQLGSWFLQQDVGLRPTEGAGGVRTVHVPTRGVTRDVREGGEKEGPYPRDVDRRDAVGDEGRAPTGHGTAVEAEAADTPESAFPPALGGAVTPRCPSGLFP